VSRYLLVFVLFFLGCSNPVKKQNELVSRGVYAVHDSLDIGRVDLGDAYIKQLVKIVPPPKTRIAVAQFKTLKPIIRDLTVTKPLPARENGKKQENIQVDLKGKYIEFPDTKIGEPIVVLPERFKNSPVIIQNSPEYIKILEENKELKKQLDNERRELAKFQYKSEEVIRDKEAIVQKAAEPKSNWFGWFTGLGFVGTILLVGGAIALMVIFPPLIPVFMQVFGAFVSGVNSLIRYIGEMFKKK